MSSERVKHSGRPLRHTDRYVRNEPGLLAKAVRLKPESVEYKHLAKSLRDDISFSKTQAQVVETSKEVWNRAEAITEDGRFLAEKIKGAIQEDQLDEDVRTELGRIDTIADEITSMAGRLDSTNKDLWYSSIKQNADQIESVVSQLKLDADHPDQFSSIKQTASEISSVVTTLDEVAPDAAGQFSAIRQTSQAIASVVGTLKLDPDDPDQYSSIRQTYNEVDLRVRLNEVIAAINLSPEVARILGKRIVLDGDVDVHGDFTLNTGVATIISEDGNMRFSGNKLEVMDDNDVVRVRIGRLDD